MKSAIAAILVLVVGPSLGWLLLAGFCSLPGVKFSNVCGHNAYVLLPVAVLLGIVAVWFVVSRFLLSASRS